MAAEKQQCTEDGCLRVTCLPPDYRPRCAKHYLADVARAQRAASDRFQARLRALQAKHDSEGRDMAEETKTCICGQPIWHCTLGDHWHHVAQPKNPDHFPEPQEAPA